jgi:flagellar protein FlaG
MDFDSLSIKNNVNYDNSNKVYESKVNTDTNSGKVTKSEKNKVKEINNKTENNKEGKDFLSGLKGSYEEKLEKTIEFANEKLKVERRSFSYSIDDKTKRVQVKITDTDSGKVIREIPTEESLNLFAKLLEFAGIIVDKKL